MKRGGQERGIREKGMERERESGIIIKRDIEDWMVARIEREGREIL